MISSLKEKAKDLGFIACGFSKPRRPLYLHRFEAWIADHKNAGMSWLGRNMDVRADPTNLLGDCRTIISLAYPYPSQKPATEDGFTVSRYSQPTEEDYHARLKRLCRGLVSVVEKTWPGSRSRICVDSAPLLERSYACASGIGFIGKNNMLIIPEYGSYFYLGEILTTAPIDIASSEPLKNQCGTCTACVDSCPNRALEMPYYLDASKCLSYLSIEDKGKIDREIGRKMGDCFFGCDRCQEVCPFNGAPRINPWSPLHDPPSPKATARSSAWREGRHRAEAEDNSISPSINAVSPAKADERKSSRQNCLPSTDAFLEMDDKVFDKRFGKTAFARAGLEKLKTNIRGIRS